MMELSTETKGQNRRKRMSGLTCNEKSEEVRCCLYPLTVDFEEFGWDWIIAPRRYEANYCSGECPYAFLQKHTHTHLIQQAKIGGIGPCCTSQKMSPISILYHDENNNFLYGTLPGMKVERCGCS